MSRKNKGPIKKRGKQEGLGGFSFRNRTGDKLDRVKKTFKYVVEPSKYPVEDQKYIVVYKCTSEHGYNEQRVFKGSYKACHEFKKIKEIEGVE